MKIIRLEEIDSTQKYAKRLAREGETDFVVVAEQQSLGTGRHGRTWGSPKGGLWFSFVCRKPEDLSEKEISFLTLAVGVSVMEVLKEVYSCEFEIKWPNDILLEGKKICGILCEKVEEAFVCGIGINTNVSVEEIRKYNPMAGSLLVNIEEKVENEALMERVLEKSIDAISHLTEKKDDVVGKMNDVLAYKGQKRYLTYLEKEAEIVRVDDKGNLVVLEDGEEKRIFAGEVL